MKKSYTYTVFSFLLISLLTFNATARVQAADPGINLQQGDLIATYINLDVQGAHTNLFGANLRYNPSSFEVIKVEEPQTICDLPIAKPFPKDGLASFSCASRKSFSTKGTVAVVILKAKENIQVLPSSFLLAKGCTILQDDGIGTPLPNSCSYYSLGIKKISSVILPPFDPIPAGYSKSITPPSFTCLNTGGDLNCDGKVTYTDFSVLAHFWNTNIPQADINNDGIVNLLDYSLLAYFYSHNQQIRK